MNSTSPTSATGAPPTGGESSAALITTSSSQSGGAGSLAAATALPDATNSSSSGPSATTADGASSSNSNNKKPSSTPNSPGTTSSRGSNTSNSKKKDGDERAKFRKGKWTIEEEEYTSRIIQYFSTGLLTLPDGATLRSYLAEKLNCDPMRITKKFTGACCLGRRAYHLRDRPRASPAEVEMARLDLQHLEQRFRLRVEHEQSGLPLPPRHEVLAAQPPACALLGGGVQGSLYQLQNGMSPSAATASGMVASAPWLQPSSQSNGAPTNPSVAAAAAAGVPNIMNPSAILNQLGTNTGNSGMVLPGTNLPFSSGPAGAAQSTIASFQNAAPERQNPSSQLPASSLQQLLLQIAVAQQQQSNVATQSSGVEQQRNNGNDGPSLQFLQNLLSSVVLAQGPNGTNQGYGASSNNNGSVQSIAPSSYPSLPASVQSRIPAPVPSIASSSAPSSGTAKMPGIPSNGFGASVFASSQAPAQPPVQASLQQQMVQNMSSKPVLNVAAKPSNPATGSSVQNGGASQSNRLSQLKAAYEKQQEALRLAYEKTLKEHEEQDKNMTKKTKVPTSSASTASKPSVSTGRKATSTSDSLVSPAEQLLRSYEAHLVSLQKDEKPKSGRKTSSSSKSAPQAALVGDKKPKQKKKKKKVAGSNRGQPEHGKSKEEEAGVLLGFLKSVRSSYEGEGGDGDDPDSSKASANANTKPKSIQKKSSGGSVGGKSAGTSTTTKQKKKQDKRVLVVSSKKPASKSGGGKRQRDSHTSKSTGQSSNPDPSTAAATTAGPARPDLQTMKDAAITAMMNSNQNLTSKQVSEASSNNSSSQPSTEQSSSSIEDSDSKSEKTDNASGEESTEEEEVINNKRSSPTTANVMNKGPPRKRLKSMKESNEFTTANLLEHSKRMDRESK